jgi:arylsulfatase A
MRLSLLIQLLPRLLVGLWFLSLGGASAFAAEKPNIVILLCDDLGYGDLSCFAHPEIRTPHLDRLAAEGVKLTHCYSSAPVCWEATHQRTT